MPDRRRALAALAALAAGPGGAADTAPLPFEDAARLPRGSVLEADIAIVGAGAAGITLARALAGSGLQVLLLEAGGTRPAGRDQALLRWAQSGQRYIDLAACRLRYFGGTTNHWAGYSTLPPAIDFAPRPELGLPGWPIDPGVLAPYLVRAARGLGHAVQDFDPAHAAHAAGAPPDALLDRRSTALTSRLFRISPGRRFGAMHGDALAAQHGLRVVLHANAVHLQLDAAGRAVQEVQLRSFDGPPLRVRAQRWVLAAHALENARLLLVSNDIARAGIGNAHGQVGRGFMEHPVLVSGVLRPGRGFSRLYDEQWASARGANWTVGLSEDRMRRLGALQTQCRLLPVFARDDVQLAMRRLRAAWSSPASAQAFGDLAMVAAHPAEFAALALRALGIRRFEPVAYRIEQRIEQAPNPASRVLLDGSRDALGMPTASLHWALDTIDERSFAAGQAVLGQEFERLGVGRVDASPLTPAAMRSRVGGLNHHAGTARMSADARTGVVDADCRVHGIRNLYVAGSAVFPRIGIANPTLLIVALAMRLADHLKQQGTA